MEKKLLPLVLVLYALFLVAGVALSVRNYTESSNLHEQTIRMMDEGFVVYSALSSLRNSISLQEPILYEYYATTDHAKFISRWDGIQRDIAQYWSIVHEAFNDHPRITAIEEQQAQVRDLRERLLTILRAERIDWDGARSVLEQLTQKALLINTSLNSLSNEMRERLHVEGMDAHNRVALIKRDALYYGMSIIAIALLAGFFLNWYLTGVRERRRLAMFVERNPNPVLRLTRKGQVDYLNPGAWSVLMTQGVAADNPLALLPDDTPERLSLLDQNGTDWATWQYAALGRHFEAVVHFLQDFNAFHVYLRDISERVLAEQRLEHMAFHDLVTELPNRRKFMVDIQEALTRGKPGVVLLLNIERMQRVVDSVGHGVADRVLKVLAKRIRQIIAEFEPHCPGASLYRYEGEIFGVLLPSMESHGLSSQIAAEIFSRFNSPLTVDYSEVYLGVSIGASRYPADGQDSISLISRADQALQQIKGTEGGYRVYESALSAEASERLMLENHLRHALERGELGLVYQPQISLSDGCLVGVEALLRWNHPVLGSIPPDKFIPIAEETGLIVSIGEWVLRTACFQAQRWIDKGLRPVRMAVNISMRQFISQTLVETVANVLSQTGLPAQCLELEVTESMAMEDVPFSIEALHKLKSLGMSVAMDDFGTGYSSLAYLRQLPIDRIKVDRAFVGNLECDPGDATLVRSIIELGNNLDLEVIAEGIETIGQMDFLHQIGCAEGQGYLFGRPVSAQDLEESLHAGLAPFYDRDAGTKKLLSAQIQ